MGISDANVKNVPNSCVHIHFIMPYHAIFCNCTGDKGRNRKKNNFGLQPFEIFPGTLKMDAELAGRVRAARALREKLVAEEIQRAPTLTLGECILQSLKRCSQMRSL